MVVLWIVVGMIVVVEVRKVGEKIISYENKIWPNIRKMNIEEIKSLLNLDNYGR